MVYRIFGKISQENFLCTCCQSSIICSISKCKKNTKYSCVFEATVFLIYILIARTIAGSGCSSDDCSVSGKHATAPAE